MTTHSHRQRIETQFVQLMAELFQLDDSEALDFGLYRVIRHHNREVRAFLGEIVSTGKESRTLQGGQLGQLLDEAFSKADHETTAVDRATLTRIEADLGLKPGMTEAQRESQLAAASAIPANKAQVDEYRALKDALDGSTTADHDRAEVLNRLYQFFSRHYQDGDFIVERRYGKGGSRYIRSTGEDTEFHWATEDMYYIKSGDIFTDYPVRLANGQRITFTVDADSLQTTRAALKPNEKAHYEFASIESANKPFSVCLKYLKGPQNDKQREEIVTRIHTQTGGDPADIKRWLSRYITRNQSDFFIHKRLREALSEDLDIFIKTEVLDTEQLLVDKNLSSRVINVGRIVRSIGLKIIDFLAALEDFQKSLWEKKKLVFETRYVITLDRLQRHCPEWLEQHSEQIVTVQRTEWLALGLGEYATAADCRKETPGDLATPAATRYLPLPADTGNFDTDFKWAMLGAVTASIGLDEALDGVAIQSDNWQALNTLQTKYREQAKCIYIDPPYNTDAGPIDYKNGYRSASWMALMDDRLKLGRRLMRDDGVLCCTIDDYEQKPLGMLLERIFGENSIAGVVSIRINPSGRPKPSGFAVSHEYGFFVQNSTTSALDRLDRTNAQMKRYKEIDNDGSYMWELFRKRGSNSERSARRTLHYPLYVSESGIRVPHIVWNELARNWTATEVPKSGETLVFPIDDNQIERTWRYKHDEVNAKPNNFRATKDSSGIWAIYYKYRPSNTGVLPTTMWIDSKFSATEHGTGVLKKLFKQHDAFSYPKSVFAVEESLKVSGATEDNALVIDFFAGSGTTAHAVLQMNANSDTNTRFLVVEVNKYFEAVTLPRIKKVAASLDWEGGSAQAITGRGAFVRVQSLEQYDDTLENLAIETKTGDSGDLLSENQSLALRYRLDQASRSLFCAVEHFSSPFGRQLKRVEGGGDAPFRDVDLVESLAYLLGLDIARLFRETEGVVMTGTNRRGESVAVFFRDSGLASSAAWVEQQLAAHPADRVFVNAPADLSFPGCEQLEAIETAFALQFGRV
ncbi:site-specific DNA-methyltransferase [Propionivibrio sp.]|uniref:site-specific DNA-methyltransferase n=1 Tax=Propionivibrio sp. TaxID=2212460 RepID=UPI003BF0B4E1